MYTKESKTSPEISMLPTLKTLFSSTKKDGMGHIHKDV